MRSAQVWLVDQFCFTPWYTAALASALTSARVPVRLVCGSLPREPHFFSSLGLTTQPGPVRVSSALHRLHPRVRRVVRAAEAVLNLKALALELRRNPPGVLHLQQLPMLARGLRGELALLHAARRSGVPVVHTVHNLLPHDTGDTRRSACAELYASADALICHSADIADQLHAQFAVPRSRIAVIPHGPLFAPSQPTTREELSRARGLLGLPLHRSIVLWQGLLAPYKGLHTLLDAWRMLPAGPLPPLLLIAGTGPPALLHQVREAARSMPATVRADLRYIPAAELPAYYAAADLLCYPHHRITTSGALLTGLGFGKPIVAARLAPFAPYLRHGDNALLTPPGDAPALARALHSLLLAADAPARFLYLAHGARRNAERCTGWRQIALQTADLYARLRTNNDERASPVCNDLHTA